METTEHLIEVAAGRMPADLVFKNALYINVFTRELLAGDIAVAGGHIAGIGQYSGKQEIDCAGLTLCPGFIDAHLHIESSMVLPAELVRAVLPSGTTTLIADPHEIVNVAGDAGLRFMLDHSRNLPCNLYYMLPSSVPSTPFETSGASFTAENMAGFLNDPAVLGLGEVMGYPGVVAGEEPILHKLALLHGRPVDGHAPGLSGSALQAYAAAGIRSEHECTSFDEALEKVRAGFAILVREGSAAHNLAAILRPMAESGLPTDRFLLCTDDKHLDDINRDGHIRWNVKLAIEMGIPPVEAVCMATWNTARAYGLADVGAIAPGYRADLVLLRDLKQVEIAAVYKDGRPASACLDAIPPFRPGPGEEGILQSVHCPALRAEDFALAVNGETPVIEMVPYALETRFLREEVPARNGLFQPDGIYSKLCVIERHGKNGNIAVAPLKGYGIQGGAIATTVAHDSHNIIAAGDNDEDIALAANRLRDMGGGYVLVQNGRVAGQVPLPVAGLMSTGPSGEVQAAVAEILQKAKAMGIPYHVDPFISLSFLALPVIPALRLTDRGLFDVEQFALL